MFRLILQHCLASCRRLIREAFSYSLLFYLPLKMSNFTKVLCVGGFSFEIKFLNLEIFVEIHLRIWNFFFQYTVNVCVFFVNYEQLQLLLVITTGTSTSESGFR